MAYGVWGRIQKEAKVKVKKMWILADTMPVSDHYLQRNIDTGGNQMWSMGILCSAFGFVFQCIF